jgi:hypothetical protein
VTRGAAISEVSASKVVPPASASAITSSNTPSSLMARSFSLITFVEIPKYIIAKRKQKETRSMLNQFPSKGNNSIISIKSSCPQRRLDLGSENETVAVPQYTNMALHHILSFTKALLSTA